MRTWTLILTEGELIALARACTAYRKQLVKGRLTDADIDTLVNLEAIDDKFPEEAWFSEEARA